MGGAMRRPLFLVEDILTKLKKYLALCLGFTGLFCQGVKTPGTKRGDH